MSPNFRALTGSLLVSTTLAASQGLTVFFQNDGNWTSHAEKPSALFVHEPASYESAVETCASYNETLLSCNKFADFHHQFTYQEYLGNFNTNEPLWSSCSSSAPATWTGSLSNTSTTSDHPFLCTNGAPLYDNVETDFAVFPHVNTTSNGTTFEGLRDHMALRFMGIPFAQAPVGSLRFKNAVPWTGSYVNATRYSPGCLQFGYFAGNSNGLNPWGNSEDCLYLNVYTSSITPASTTTNSSTAAPLKPVLFWIHGGGQVTGTGTDATFDGASLASRTDAVVVTVNYRLNIFGYLALDDGALAGNYALTDHVAALTWVRAHVRAFGGDPDNVTILGQSAGGSSVINLLSSPSADGLFQGAVVQSGGRGFSWTPAVAAAAVLPYLQPLCPETTNSTQGALDRLECLQGLPAETLLNVTKSAGSWQTVIDGALIPEAPVALLAQGKAHVNSVRSVVVGWLPEEGQSLAQTAIAPNATDFNATLQALVAQGSLTAAQADVALNSGLWEVDGSTSGNGSAAEGATHYTSAYNATVNVYSDVLLTCNGAEYASVGAASGAWPALYVYEMQRAYGMSYYNFYNACSFPVGQPDTPYYRCHSGELYEVFGTYFLFGQPVRVPEDIYYTNAVMDMWAAFARTGSPNVEEEYLVARGYESTQKFFDGWAWPRFETWDQRVASLQYPGPGYTTLPEQRHCKALQAVATS